MGSIFRSNNPLRREHAGRANAAAPVGALAQTKSSWAKPVTSFDELAKVYAEPLRQLLGEAKLPYAVLTPTYAGHLHPENEKLVFMHDGRLHVWERAQSGLSCVSYALQAIHLLESVNILLYSRLGIHGAARDGKLTTSLLRFNSVSGYLFYPFIQAVRGAGGAASEAEIAKLADLCAPNFKFMNYARHALGTDDRIVDALWQSEIRTILITLLGRAIYRSRDTTHLLILTERELLFLHEDELSPRGLDGSRYGGVWTWIPLSKIIATTLTKTAENLLVLSVQLPGKDSLRSLFLAAQQGDVERFVGRIENHR